MVRFVIYSLLGLVCAVLSVQIALGLEPDRYMPDAFIQLVFSCLFFWRAYAAYKRTFPKKPSYDDLYFNIFSSYMSKIYTFSDEEIKEMKNFILSNTSDYSNTTMWSRFFYDKYLQDKNWCWKEFIELKNIVYDIAKNDEKVKKSYLWWVFSSDTAPEAIVPGIIKKLKVGEKRQILTTLNIPFEKGTKSADLSTLLLERVTPKQFVDAAPDKVREIRKERLFFLFQRLLTHIQTEAINQYNMAILRARGITPKFRPRKGYGEIIVKRMKKVPKYPPLFPEDRFEKESHIY